MLRQFLRNASSNPTKVTASITSTLSPSTNNSHVNTSKTQRPELLTILPSKRILNRILFDIDSQLTYKQMMPILNHIYNNLSTPESINLTQLKIQSSSYDLMKFKKLLQEIRKVTNSINVHLLDLENELIEQSAELGNNDAISILAFETIRKRQILKEIVDEEDYKHANELIKQLIDINHPLVFKMAGDLSWELNQPNQAIEYWQNYIDLVNKDKRGGGGDDYDDHLCQIYYNMGYYYFTYLKHPKLSLAKLNFQKCINHGSSNVSGSSTGSNSNEFIVKSHFYLGQLYVNNNPKLSKYHWEIASSSGLKDSIINLGFLEMNCFQNYHLAIEWFKLGMELNPSEVQCLIGLFDAYIALQNWKSANIYLSKLNKLFETIAEKKKTSELPENIKSSIIYNESMLKTFHQTRLNDIKLVTSKIV
ncbi:mitochondrial inner membrane protein, putative [Candida dubliniensis CD36]|uniref:Mitochondrial inner membrane protein, putative n=1 Tax=Candida dubliniensis (strain CD36 / ATCC MYA-646 / CBS 7987 / NCPF 3949 / NRRL Y-17841) TaxID=573826 RepID=B9WI51_CANDC|nr:mitochondrial inner membrane protein, putative [Candida dubliniensis CD36]CAX41848.1 mitochondrial inner membrane protein, putative [Candida dubliniensis CD36]